MTFTDAAHEVLKQAGTPLHYKEITEIAIEQNLLSHVGKSPEVTMGARLAATLKKGGDDNPLIRVKPGVFALREWDQATIDKGLEIKRAPARKKKDDKKKDEGSKKGAKKDDASKDKKSSKGGKRAKKPLDEDDEVLIGGDDDDDEDAEPSSKGKSKRSRSRSRSRKKKDEEPTSTSKPEVADEPQGADEAKRAEIAADAKEVFEDEDDDDQPILKNDSDDDDDDEPQEGGRRRRRRRRRRGSRSKKDDDRKSNRGGKGKDDLPSYSAKSLDDDGLPRGPQVIELSNDDMPALDDLSGRMLADAIVAVLGTFDRTVGAVSLRQIAETAQRHGKLAGDQQLAQAQISAAVRADNARRVDLGLRPRFRVAGGRVGLTDWLLDADVARYEGEVFSAVNRFRDASRKALAKKIGELPGHAFVELVMLVLERVGASNVKTVKFPGASGSEVHLSTTLCSPSGVLPSQIGVGEGIRLAIVIRKDGRDLGRERVTELRGAAHHYDGAALGWIFTGGSLLSGAKEEATVEKVMPVTVLDAYGVARLCEDHGVGVVRANNPVFVPDVDLFEALRSS